MFFLFDDCIVWKSAASGVQQVHDKAQLRIKRAENIEQSARDLNVVRRSRRVRRRISRHHEASEHAERGTSGSSKSLTRRPAVPGGDVDPLTCPPPPGMEDTPSAPSDRKKKLEKKEKKASEKPALEFEAHAFRIVGDTKTLVVCADSRRKRGMARRLDQVCG